VTNLKSQIKEEIEKLKLTRFSGHLII
jgi:hypothetical protein